MRVAVWHNDRFTSQYLVILWQLCKILKLVVQLALRAFLRSEAQYSGGALSWDTLPMQNQPCLCPELPLYPSAAHYLARPGNDGFPNAPFHLG